MTRFGVMKHLKVLEDAGLVVTRRQGREKLHFLNPVPIRLVHDRWVSKYAEPWAAGLSGLKQELETSRWRRCSRSTSRRRRSDSGRRSPIPRSGPSTTSAPAPAPTGSPAARIELQAEATSSSAKATVLEVDPPRRLVHTMIAHFSPEAEAEGDSRVTWEIEPVGDSCRLTLTHDQMRDGANEQIYGGWPMILSGLKTWLESGELLTTPGSLMYT